MGSTVSHNLLLFGFSSCLNWLLLLLLCGLQGDFLDFVCFAGDKWLTIVS